jgi:hypothetical protein
LRGGDIWDQKIRREVRDCALFIPVISANTASRHAGYFRLEWDLTKYALGSTDAEHNRLIGQADRVAPLTEHLFREAGIGPGQRILDIGSGVGDGMVPPVTARGRPLVVFFAKSTLECRQLHQLARE